MTDNNNLLKRGESDFQKRRVIQSSSEILELPTARGIH